MTDAMESLFEEQFGDLPCGGLLNPQKVEETNEHIIFRCNYDNFEGDDDAWYYGYNKETKQFYYTGF
jgi:hypothetical protein